MVCVFGNAQGVLPTRETCLSLGIQGFTGGQSPRQEAPLWLALVTQPPSSPEARLLITWPKAPIMNHNANVNYLGTTAPSRQIQSYQGGCSKGLEVIS